MGTSPLRQQRGSGAGRASDLEIHTAKRRHADTPQQWTSSGRMTTGRAPSSTEQVREGLIYSRSRHTGTKRLVKRRREPRLFHLIVQSSEFHRRSIRPCVHVANPRTSLQRIILFGEQVRASVASSPHRFSCRSQHPLASPRACREEND